MKKSTYPLIALLLFSVLQFSYSQEITGIATYKSFLKFDLKTDSTKVNDEMRDQFKQLINQQTQKEYELQFNNNEAVFKEKEKLETPGNEMFAGAMISRSGQFGSFYQNLKKNIYVNQIDLYSKLFLISDSIQKRDWILEKETKTIGEYTCFKATYVRVKKDEITGGQTETPITAWYTPQIPVAFGPMNHGGLPGLILEVNEGDYTYLCSKIVLNPKNAATIGPATKGKKVSQE